MDYKDIANIEEQTCKAEEPMLNSSILTLRRRVMERVSQTTSESDLYECLSVLEHEEDIIIPQSYEQAIFIGAMELEQAREQLHSYVNELSAEYHLR